MHNSRSLNRWRQSCAPCAPVVLLLWRRSVSENTHVSEEKSARIAAIGEAVISSATLDALERSLSVSGEHQSNRIESNRSGEFFVASHRRTRVSRAHLFLPSELSSSRCNNFAKIRSSSSNARLLLFCCSLSPPCRHIGVLSLRFAPRRPLVSNEPNL